MAEMPAALAQPGLRIRAIKVDVSPDSGQHGRSDRGLVEEALPGARPVAWCLYGARRP
jgi:hypothetical protein